MTNDKAKKKAVNKVQKAVRKAVRKGVSSKLIEQTGEIRIAKATSNTSVGREAAKADEREAETA